MSAYKIQTPGNYPEEKTQQQKKVHGNTADLNAVSILFHTNPPNEAVTHGLSRCSKRGRGTEVIHLTTLTIAKIYIMLLVVDK
jgi:hypothetical protein